MYIIFFIYFSVRMCNFAVFACEWHWRCFSPIHSSSLALILSSVLITSPPNFVLSANKQCHFPEPLCTLWWVWFIRLALRHTTTDAGPDGRHTGHRNTLFLVENSIVYPHVNFSIVMESVISNSEIVNTLHRTVSWDPKLSEFVVRDGQVATCN